jgi:Bacterial regulatory proteins, gntR family
MVFGMTRNARPVELPVSLPPSGAPLRHRVADALIDLLRTGHLRPGDTLPATRTLAAELAISRTAVLAAYDELAAAGFIHAVAGSATVVSPGAAIARCLSLAIRSAAWPAAAGARHAPAPEGAGTPHGNADRGRPPLSAPPQPTFTPQLAPEPPVTSSGSIRAPGRIRCTRMHPFLPEARILPGRIRDLAYREALSQHQPQTSGSRDRPSDIAGPLCCSRSRMA